MNEKLVVNSNFEQSLYREHERKLVPIFPDMLKPSSELMLPIKQYYLSHPDEPFSLRLREIAEPDGTYRYTAAIKDRGVIAREGLDRLEVEVAISQKLYEFYKQSDAPLMRKLRYVICPDTVVDWSEDGHVQLELENDAQIPVELEELTPFVDVTGDRTADSEWRAHMAYRRANGGKEALAPQADIDIDIVADELERCLLEADSTILKVNGRSGSGKSTIVAALQATLRSRGIDSVVLSTDDYHRGGTWLRRYNDGKDWTEWDHPIVYDTSSLASDINWLQAGISIRRRSIDFSVAEPVYGDLLDPAPVIILEGIYSRSPDFDGLESMSIDIPTSLATCIGRRLLRDMRERPEFADPAKSFSYILEQAEPMWRNQNEAAQI